MNAKQFAKATESAEEILNAFAEELGEPADWSMAWAEWHSGTFMLKLIYPPNTRKSELRWLLQVRRYLAEQTRSKWAFIIYRRLPMADIEIIRRYVEKIQAHGGGITESDLDADSEGL